MQTIDLDICRYQAIQGIYAKQGDVGRKFRVRITDCGIDFPVPEGAKLSVWYSGTSGEGNYSEIAGKSAFTVEGSTVTVEMIAQMLMNKGGGTLCLIMNNEDGSQLGTWTIPYFAEAVPGMDSKSADQYYTAFSESVTKAVQAAQRSEELAEEIGTHNMFNKAMVHERHGIGATGYTLDQVLSNIYNKMENSSNIIVDFLRGEDVKSDDLVRFSLGEGSNWMVLITRSKNTYGSMFAWQYGKDTVVTKVRTMYGNGWSDWKPLIPDVTEGSWVELWVNKAENSAFPAQKVTVPYGYKRLVIKFRHSIWYGHPTMVNVFNGELGICDFPSGAAGDKLRDHTCRFANRINEATISFQSGVLNGALNDNGAIPIAIYGVKY